MRTTAKTVIWLALTLLATSMAYAANELHPPVPLLDLNGALVMESGLPVSLMQSCDGCHDTTYIAETNSHAWMGDAALLKSIGEHGATGLAYELGVENHGFNSEQHNETTELNCLLCHLVEPDYKAYKSELGAESLDWAITAMLGQKIVSRVDNSFSYVDGIFDVEGKVSDEILGITSATPNHCGRCHDTVYFGSEPLHIQPSMAPAGLGRAGQVFSAQRPSESAMNLAGKDRLTQPWDVHAESKVDCVDCHHSANSPNYYGAAERSDLKHLTFDPRVQSLQDYLKKPSHLFTPGVEYSMDGVRNTGNAASCIDCHDGDVSHGWLPEREQHYNALSCEACHIPRLHMPARMVTDWTLLTTAGEPLVRERGIDGEPGNPAALIEGYEPVLLPGEDGLISPFNLSTSWYWVAGGQGEPVSLAQLQDALLVDGAYRAGLIAALDTDGDGELSRENLRLDSEAKTAAVAGLLSAAGVVNPRIEGEVNLQPINHSVVSDGLALKDCAACHSAGSRMNAGMELAGFLPGGVMPGIDPDTHVDLKNSIQLTDGSLVYQPQQTCETHYIMGHHRWKPGDIIGVLAIAGVLALVLVHGAIRLRAPQQNAKGEAR